MLEEQTTFTSPAEISQSPPRVRSLWWRISKWGMLGFGGVLIIAVLGIAITYWYMGPRTLEFHERWTPKEREQIQEIYDFCMDFETAIKIAQAQEEVFSQLNASFTITCGQLGAHLDQIPSDSAPSFADMEKTWLQERGQCNLPSPDSACDSMTSENVQKNEISWYKELCYRLIHRYYRYPLARHLEASAKNGGDTPLEDEDSPNHGTSLLFNAMGLGKVELCCKLINHRTSLLDIMALDNDSSPLAFCCAPRDLLPFMPLQDRTILAEALIKSKLYLGTPKQYAKALALLDLTQSMYPKEDFAPLAQHVMEAAIESTPAEGIPACADELLRLAICGNWHHSIEYLLERDANIATRGSFERPAIFALKTDDESSLPTLQFLITKGANLDIENEEGTNFIELLSKSRALFSSDALEVVLQAGADPNKYTEVAKSPLAICLSNLIEFSGDPDPSALKKARLLLDHGVVVSPKHIQCLSRRLTPAQREEVLIVLPELKQ